MNFFNIIKLRSGNKMMVKYFKNLFSGAILAFILAPSLVCGESVSSQALLSYVPSFADTVQKILPAIVEISTEQNFLKKRRRGLQDVERLLEMPEIQSSPLGALLKEMVEGGRDGEGGSRKNLALGSGFIIDPKGYIVTNCHVIQGADHITVSLSDGQEMPAKIIARDKRTDLALLKVDNKNPLPALKWGDSHKSRVGDWVLAVGSPFGFGRSVSAGIISARARDLSRNMSVYPGEEGILTGYVDDLIQTDAAINLGNSGGPMVSTEGEVIGVNVAIFSPSGGSVGIGFAVPSSVAMRCVEEMKQNGHVRYGWIGVQVQEVTKDISKTLKLDDKDDAMGALVAQVMVKGPAEKAGVQAKDIILKFDGQPIKNFDKLTRIVGETPIGKKVFIDVWRNGKKETLSLVVEAYPNDHDEEESMISQVSFSSDTINIPLRAEKEPHGEVQSYLGLTLSPLTSDLLRQLKLNEKTQGVLVLGVDRYTQATGNIGNFPFPSVNIEIDDVIEEINKKPVRTLDDVEKTLKEVGSTQSLVLKIWRKDEIHYVALPIAQIDEAKPSDLSSSVLNLSKDSERT